jgi:hypothetical protein
MNASHIELPPARILHVTEEEYFADPCETPSLTQSIAKLLLANSPLHAWSAHPRLGGAPVEDEAENEDDEESESPSDAVSDGKVLHSLMLGQGVDVVVINEDSFRKKTARAARDEARAAGKVPMIAAKYDLLVKAAGRLRDRLAAAGYPLNGESEVAIEWYERGENGPVVCRCRMDHVFMTEGRIYDIKKVRSAHPEKIARNFVDYGYDIQQAAYPRALAALNPKLQGRVDFTFLYMESVPPYSIVPAGPDGAFREIGLMRWLRAVKLWERCLATNYWPGYTDTKVTLQAPLYVVQREIGNAPDSL